jgi:2C-methyl-D-erythritol 2,4-cyclodiphosphate synthase
MCAEKVPDLRAHFPDTDPRWNDADSPALLRQLAALAQGWGRLGFAGRGDGIAALATVLLVAR